MDKPKPKIMIYEARARAASSAYHKAIGGLQYISEKGTTWSDAERQFTRELLDEMKADYAREMDDMRGRYEVDECE